MKTAILALVLAVSASAQFTIVMSTDASSNGTTVHESVALAYSGTCVGCGYAYHTWNGSLVDPTSGRNCSFNAGAPASNSLNIGCALDISLTPGVDQSFTGTATIKGLCSVIGLFFNMAFLPLQTVKITNAYSGYKLTGCYPSGVGTWWCTTSPSGPGCPGKCTTATGKLILGQPQLYGQCKDVIVNGICVSQLCATQTFQGFCTSGPVN